uniref:uncharacterized protein LOC109957896 n=1 Tax=Monopterus albus TaxID=43700 RepID=UPI0009B4B4FB|nr:uncharacterized protein LOC109957896 [Monopterus albus]
MVNKEVVLPKQKCGRLQKRKHEECAPKNPAVAENESHNGEGPQINKDLPKEDSDKGDKAKIRCIKRRGNRSTEVKTIPLKTIITESTGKSDTNNNDISPALRSIGTRRRPQMITLKGSQKLIGLHHCKTRKSKENLETKGTVRDAESEGAASRESTFQESTGEMTTVTHIAHPQDGDGGVESPIVVSVLVDENHSHIYNKEEETTRRNDTVSSTSETILFGDEPVLSFEDVTKLAAETEQPLKSSAEGKTCDAGVLNTAKQTDVKKTGLSHNDTHPQENKLVSDHNFCPQIPERTGPPLWETGGISGTPGCGQEADEEVEVDVLLCSPDMIAETEECEHGHNLKINLDNEEEEDMSEIDVTGDDGIVLYHVV